MKYLLFLFNFAVTSLAFAEVDHAQLDALSQRLLSPAIIEADFVQTRKIAALSRPLVTTGHLMLIRDKGLMWERKMPLAKTWVFSKDRILEIHQNKIEKEILQKEQGAIMIHKIIEASLSGSFRELEANFRVILIEKDKKTWALELIPTQKEWQQFLTKLELHGKEQIERVLIFDKNQEETEIRFENHRLNRVLSQEEIKWF